MYAVIQSGGKQYRVSEGDVVRLEKLEGDAGTEIEIREVLLLKTDEKTYIGQPLVEGATVKGVVEGQGRNDTVLVFKTKRRKQYRRTRGHRQAYSDVRIEKISIME